MSIATRIKDWAAELFVRAEQRGRFRKLPAFERDLHEYPELGMEAIWRIEVVDFPAFIIIDDKGNDFFKELNLG